MFNRLKFKFIVINFLTNIFFSRHEYESTCIEQEYIEPETLEECRAEIIKKINDFDSSSHIKSVVSNFINYLTLCNT